MRPHQLFGVRLQLKAERHRPVATLPAVDGHPESLTRTPLPMLHPDIFNISKAPKLKQNLNFNRSPVCPVYFSPGTI